MRSERDEDCSINRRMTRAPTPHSRNGRTNGKCKWNRREEDQRKRNFIMNEKEELERGGGNYSDDLRMKSSSSFDFIK